MLARVGLVTGSVVSFTVWQTTKVHAAAEPTISREPKKKIRPSELPIYGEPEPAQFECVPEWETEFHHKVTDARKWTWSYLDSIQDKTDRAKSVYDVGKAHTLDFLSYIHEDSSVLPRAAIITVSGLGGIVIGYRGGLLKKTLLSGTLMTAAAAVCYPREASAVSRMGLDMATQFTKNTYDTMFDSSSQKDKRSPASKAVGETKSKDAVTSAVKTKEPVSKAKEDTPAAASKTKDNSPKMDFGMSKPEDDDMYTTRDSDC